MNHFWLIENNDHLTGITEYRDQAFPNVVTTLNVVRRRKQLTPFNLARGFDGLLDNVLRSQDWTNQYYDWLFGSYIAGNTKTELSETEQMAVDGPKASSQGNETVGYGSHVRTRFTGTPVPAWKFFCMFRQLMNKLWVYNASGSMFDLSRHHSALIIEDTSAAPYWELRFDFKVSDEQAQMIQWSTVTALLLELLQLPAATNHWETLVCNLYTNQLRFAEVTFSVGNRNLDTSPSTIQKASDKTNLTYLAKSTFAL